MSAVSCVFDSFKSFMCPLWRVGDAVPGAAKSVCRVFSEKGDLVWSELSIFVDFCRFFWDIFTKIPQNNEKGTTEKSRSNEHRKKGTRRYSERYSGRYIQRALHTADATYSGRYIQWTLHTAGATYSGRSSEEEDWSTMIAISPITVSASSRLSRTIHPVNVRAPKSPGARVRVKSTPSPDAFVLPEDEFQLFYKVSDYDCSRMSDSPLLRDHVGLFTYALSDFEGDGHEVKLTREKLETIGKINVDRKHVSLLNVGIASSHCRNLGWIKVIDAFRSGGAQSISYQFQHRYAELYEDI